MINYVLFRGLQNILGTISSVVLGRLTQILLITLIPFYYFSPDTNFVKFSQLLFCHFNSLVQIYNLRWTDEVGPGRKNHLTRLLLKKQLLHLALLVLLLRLIR